MRHGIAILALLFTSLLQANSFVITDPFNVEGDSDVIGNKQLFDIESAMITLDPAMVTIKIRMNTDNIDLNPFGADPKLDVGDIFFDVNGQLRYGIPLRDHEGSTSPGGPTGLAVLAGHLYQINSLSDGLMTARQALGDPSNYSYRPEQVVWLWNNNGALTDLNVGSPKVTVANIPGNDGVNGPLYEIAAQFERPAGFLDNLDAVQFYFASATCGNDVIEGFLVPEPGTIFITAGGFLALALLRRRSRQ